MAKAWYEPNSGADDTPGKAKDLAFLWEGTWLHHTEVRYVLIQRQGRWYLYLIFIATSTPLKFMVRAINQYPTREKALTYAEIFLRSVRKDARGVLKTNEDAFNLCYN